MAPAAASSFLSPLSAAVAGDGVSLKNVRAVLFDQFGTLTDWQGSICRLLEEEEEARKSDESLDAGSQGRLPLRAGAEMPR